MTDPFTPPSGEPAPAPPPPAQPPVYGAPYGAPAAGGPMYGDPYGAPYGPPAKKNGFGVTALVLGILSIPGNIFLLGVVLGPLGVIFGFLGRGRAKRGEADNGGLALAGLICGAIGTVIALAAIAFFIAHRDEIGSYTECVYDANGNREAERICQERFADTIVG